MSSILTKRVVWQRPKQIGPSRYTPDMTEDERANVRKALQVLRRRFGSWPATAEALGVKPMALEHAMRRSRRPSVALALRAARVAGVPLEDVLSGAWPKAGSCPMCGRCG